MTRHEEQAAPAVWLDDLLTIGEVAVLERTSPRTIFRRLERGELAYVQAGGRRLIEKRELLAYRSRNRRRVAVA